MWNVNHNLPLFLSLFLAYNCWQIKRMSMQLKSDPVKLARKTLNMFKQI
jgi:hypothetical protein